ncbi:UDP-3-O-acyl-N-acetylglucosamine deacetylase [Rhodopila sp.]|jgi:UDP-3-O-[3-hydroxymyristoyl] N-acetylglucosamine deacetylase|uniref:UDP-3-O-acyl-N-acetylglucosamine deacetylase n=1 Tax=Rhodopila sp. TaxID=2480087 RepID=UPI002C5A3E83|nr:UDP-3-O-acyl-N-acetylglucosamine deacetylase [Rhodopila sp.]HVZ07715.1 UDP-3-O-acyl-N-acetylglucosamine deacetylase [Rhodopila sp.]
MDRLVTFPLTEANPNGFRQRTLKTAIDCVGIGVHSGRKTRLVIRPAEAGHGIVFQRTDLNRTIPARYDTVCETRLCTVIADPAMPSARVGTIEHIMAAFHGAGIDNALIEVDGPEVPILDGSAGPYLFLLDCAGSVEQDAPRAVIEVRTPVRVAAGEAWAELRPLGPLPRNGQPTLEMELSIDFKAPVIGQQSETLRLTSDNFRHRLANARTFAMAAEVEQLRASGLARGGSLDNAVVVDGDSILNPGGLRMDKEFVHHKLLDAVGDLALAGACLHGRFVAHRTGHTLNNRLLHTLFAQAADWRASEAGKLSAAA